MRNLPSLCLLLLLTACGTSDPLRRPGETHLRNIRQLTDGGENAEGYFDWAGQRLVFQSTRAPYDCDQIFVMDLDSATSRLVSTGKGRTTCAYFMPDGKRVLYASTHLAGDACPPKPGHQNGYVWPIYPSYDIFIARVDDGKILQRLTSNPGYDAEATIAPDGSRIVFTSVRKGDLDIYSMKTDGSDVKRLTTKLGYDGGPFFSPDSKKIVYRAAHPQTPEAEKSYRALLAKNLIRPTQLDIWVMNADGSGKIRLTDNSAANFCPYFHPSGKQVIFASNLANPKGRNFDLYLINLDGSGLKRITHDESFDGFPMFSPDGKQLVWASNRNNKKKGETNLFIADWIE